MCWKMPSLLFLSSNLLHPTYQEKKEERLACLPGNGGWEWRAYTGEGSWHASKRRAWGACQKREGGINTGVPVGKERRKACLSGKEGRQRACQERKEDSVLVSKGRKTACLSGKEGRQRACQEMKEDSVPVRKGRKTACLSGKEGRRRACQ